MLYNAIALSFRVTTLWPAFFEPLFNYSQQPSEPINPIDMQAISRAHQIVTWLDKVQRFRRFVRFEHCTIRNVPSKNIFLRNWMLALIRLIARWESPTIVLIHFNHVVFCFFYRRSWHCQCHLSWIEWKSHRIIWVVLVLKMAVLHIYLLQILSTLSEQLSLQ